MRWHLAIRAACVAGLIVIHAVVAPEPPSAAELVVPTDFALLEEAVAAAADGDTVTALAGEHLIVDSLAWGDRDIVLRSLSGAPATTIRGVDNGSDWHHIFINSGATEASVLEGFTLAEFFEGAITIRDASPTLRNLVIFDCGVDADFAPRGGGILCYGGSPVLIGVRFLSNQSRSGGALYCSGGSPQFYSCSFESNWAIDGGAVCLGGSSASFVGCSFVDNDARTYYNWDDLVYMDGHGGAVFAYGGAPTFIQCLFIDNRARDIVQHDTVALGGAGYFTYQSAPIFTACTLVGNGASTLGGAILARDEAQPSLNNSIIAFTTEGGGLVAEDESAGATLACCDVYDNVGGNYVGMQDPTGQDGNISANPLFCDVDAGELTLAADSPCLPGGNDCGVQMGALGEGCTFPTDVGAPPPAGIALGLNYPNPFNPGTAIPFGLTAPARVSVTVLDVAGRLVTTLASERAYPAGSHELRWDGMNAAGRSMPSGMYFYRLEAPEGATARPMLLVK